MSTIVKKTGLSDSFRKLYWNTKNAIETYKRKLVVWLKKYNGYSFSTE